MHINRQKFRYEYKHVATETDVINNIHEVALWDDNHLVNLGAGKFGNSSGEMFTIDQIYSQIQCAWEKPSGYPIMKRKYMTANLQWTRIVRKRKYITKKNKYKPRLKIVS